MKKQKESYNRKYRLHLMNKRPSYCFIVDKTNYKVFEDKLKALDKMSFFHYEKF
jgi:hypothetical protein